VARRGEVLRAKRRLGFSATGVEERFVVLQHDRLNALLPTVLVAPLDTATAAFEGRPGAIPVSPEEAGTESPQVLLATAVTWTRWETFQPGVVGRLLPSTLAEVDRALRMVLDLP